ncbi:hypothetical protein FRUB_10168 [Fimbriiglobus ruber]|uniref:Uncharacterized protein n=1 Tax=Fimbriiglobus ruber TaxID=1908690 RepID=A0A225DDK8_9BACT|nr:hypothetical protein FRUB_10168 [Fimbriiglobus ruber]
MTPKGVDHFENWCETSLLLKVMNAVTPKGVDHSCWATSGLDVAL